MEHTHHLTYRNVGAEDLHELLGVCGLCHQFLHGLATYDPCRTATFAELEKMISELRA
jgi:hypothetical protein